MERSGPCLHCGASGIIARGLCVVCYARDYRRRRRYKHKNCIVCGQSFMTPHRDAKFCSGACRQRNYHQHRNGKIREEAECDYEGKYSKIAG